MSALIVFSFHNRYGLLVKYHNTEKNIFENTCIRLKNFVSLHNEKHRIIPQIGQINVDTRLLIRAMVMGVICQRAYVNGRLHGAGHVGMRT